MARPVVLCILDGWGLREEREANAVALANTPNFDRLMETCPNSTLIAQGTAVGLPEGQMGNSEVGHMNIGAGRTVWMSLPRIDNAISDGSFGANPALLKFIERLKTSGGVAHLAGLVSPGGVHSHTRHVLQTARVLSEAGVPVVIHAITDGRDVEPKSAQKILVQFEANLPEDVEIATVIGRFYAMDRDNRWERVQAAFEAMTHADGEIAQNAQQAVAAAYESDQTDEFIPPTVIGDYKGMKDGDGLLFLNFRADRARELLSALAAPEFGDFDAGKRPELAAVTGLVEYSDAHNAFMDVMFASSEIVNTLGAWVASKGLKQFRIAETEKYPHVTFFFNGGKETPENGEVRYLAPSPKVRTYDLQPEMSAAEVTTHLVEAIRSKDYDLIVVNFANPDMVGHTGDLAAAIAACEAVDKGVGDVLGALDDVDGCMLLTADHGNCEMMINPETGGPHTAHTLNPVPLVLYNGPVDATLGSGKLGDLAPSLLMLMGVEQPDEMTGTSLIGLP